MTQPLAIIRPGPTFYDDIIEAMRARQNELGLRYAFMDEWSGRAATYWTKVLSPRREKALSLSALNDLAAMFGFEVHLVVNMDAIRKMEAHWEKREGNYRSKEYRFVASKIGKELVERAKPLVLKANGKLGGAVRACLLSPKQAEEIARKGGQARAKKLTVAQRREIAIKGGRARAEQRKAKTDEERCCA